MTPSNVALHALGRLLSDQPVNGEIERVEAPYRPFVEHLAALPFDSRGAAWDVFCMAPGVDRDALTKALAEVDPTEPEPPAEPPRVFATVADVRRVLAETRWLWEGWIPSARIIGVGGFEGTGKTRFALDLCRRIFHGAEWPDSQAPTLPRGTRSIWMCSDAHQDELADMVPAFGLPDEAVVFPTTPEDPYGGTDLDNPETLHTLDEAIRQVKPGLVFIDTLTSATSKDLCDQRSMKPLKAPLADLVQRHQVSIVLMLHLSREGQALGRRIKGITRTLIHLEAPDPEQPARLKLWVEKSFDKRPQALGVTMGDAGNDYDRNPPRAPEPNRGGRSDDGREKAKDFIRKALAEKDGQVANDLSPLCQKETGVSDSTFWRAARALRDAGEITMPGGKGTGQQITLWVAQPAPDDPF